MSLKPLQQWYCDRCGEIIEKPEDGWLHWRREGEPPAWKVYSIEILHPAPCKSVSARRRRLLSGKNGAR
jgi:hypothetical protein